MNSREKRLSIFLVVVLFLIGNVLALKKFYLPKLEDARSEVESLEAGLEQAEFALEMEGEMKAEMDWLLKYEPQPIPSQKAESQLEQLANREAQRRGLTVGKRKIQPAIVDSHLKYHRARVELQVSGSEHILYQWLDRLHSPPDFRAVTFMRLNPKRDDDTQVDCQVVVEQWFVPEA